MVVLRLQFGTIVSFFDGITLASGNRVLVKDASKTDANGIYTCTNAGGAGAKVILTREEDIFVRLKDRTKFANVNKGDLFISIDRVKENAKSFKKSQTFSI